MSLDFDTLFPDLNSFDPKSKVWVYFSDRKFSNEEVNEVQAKIDHFCHDWTSHGSKVKGKGFLVLNRIIILIADETQSGVSGCSTDSSVRFIKSIELDYLTNLMNREYIYILGEDNFVENYPIKNINELNPDSTKVFNPFFKDLDEFRHQWMISLRDSMYKRMI